jgi:pimeloyl-ACP methyl ester carboxylesterase
LTLNPESDVLTPASELRRTSVGDFTIHSEHAGTGPAVVLLHGLSGSRRWWRFTLPALAKRYRVHIPELVGFGGSRAPTRHPDLPEMADILAAWISSLGEPLYGLVGHSMGGQVAVHITARHLAPARLALVCSTGVPRPLSVRMAARFVTGAMPPRRWGDPTFVPTIAADALRAGPLALLHATRNLLRDDVRPLLRRVPCPTLVVWGALDPLVPVEHGRALARGVPGARFVVMADAAHNPMADRPIEFNRVLLDFLDL